MAGGVIIAEKATGAVNFVDGNGAEVLPPVFNIEVDLKQEFGGLTKEDAIEEAKRYAIGAFKNKMQQKIRGKNCTIIPRNIEIQYTVKYGFGK
jgi:hypothetical protein